MTSKKGDYETDHAYRTHSPSPRVHVISIRANTEEYNLMFDAAYIQGLSLGAFIMGAALPKAKRIIKAN